MKSGIKVIVLVTILLQSSSSNGWNWNDVDPEPTTSTTTTITTTNQPFPTTVPFSTTSTSSNPHYAKCMKRCPSTHEYDPVCGTDDMTYQNENTLLCAIQCHRKISKKHAGVCVMRPTSSTTQSSVSPTTSPIPSTTTSRSHKKCIKRCPSTHEDDPVCGTNGITYQNLSKLWCAKRCGTVVEKLHDGPCNSFSTSTTTSTTTESSITPDPKCIKSCSSIGQYDPVCGTNGKAYENESKLSCAKQCGVNVDLAYQGTCNRGPPTPSTTSTRSPVKSTTLPPHFSDCVRQCTVSFDYKPVCATDGTTYDNETLLQCDVYCGKDVEKLRDGAC